MIDRQTHLARRAPAAQQPEAGDSARCCAALVPNGDWGIRAC